MSHDEIMARIITLQRELTKIQLELRDLWLDIREGLDKD